MLFDLAGKTALITGATGGIGSAIAQALHAQGATVALSGTRGEVLDVLQRKLGERSHVFQCDLARSEEVEKLVPLAETAMGSLDILVNNAGITRDKGRGAGSAPPPPKQIIWGRGGFNKPPNEESTGPKAEEPPGGGHPRR